MVRRGTQHIWLVLLALTMTSVVFLPARGEEPEKSKDAVHIGLVNTLFRDTPEALLKVVMEPFGSLMESQTGVHGQLIMAGDAHDLTQRLKDGKIQLGVFNGVEFAWAQQEYPELKPLMIAVCKDPRLHAYIVVRNDSEISSFDDLHQKSLAVPRRSRQHCHLFLRRCCRERGHEAKNYFTQITAPAGVESALDDVVAGKVQASVVDSVGLDSYQREKPGCYARLKTIKVSETFPAAVIVYVPGRLDAGTLGRFKDGMSRANDTAVGRQLLSAVRLTGFEQVPSDYQKTLTDIIKAYPPPSAAEKTPSVHTATKSH